MRKLLLLLALSTSFAYASEAEPQSLEEEEAAAAIVDESIIEKIEQLEQMQYLRDVVEKDVEATNEEEGELWLVAKIYLWGLFISGLFSLSTIAAIIFVQIFKSMVFNYNMYIEHGEFLYFKDEIEDLSEEELEKVLSRAPKILSRDRAKTYPWFSSLGEIGSVILVFSLCALLWPATLIVLGPNFFVFLTTLRKRKKRVFEKKLKGEMTNGSV